MQEIRFLAIAFAFLLVLLLHFSAVVSRMADHSRRLAQRLALLEARERARGADRPPPTEASGDPREDDREPAPPRPARSRPSGV